jgi:hypothetical protein
MMELANLSIDFLKTSTEDGTVKEDDKESMEVASESLYLFCVSTSHLVRLDANYPSSMPRRVIWS